MTRFSGLFRLLMLGMLWGLFATTSMAATPPQVKIQTNHGDIIVEVYPDKAPKTVANFLQYVNDGFYSDTIFHRVISGFMIQGGGFTQKFERKSTRAPVVNEADNGLTNQRGTIAMARTFEPHSATAQFFINVVDNAPLNHTNKTPRGWGYCVFGKVIKGMDIVDKIRHLPTGPGGPFQRDVPKSTAIITGMSLVNSNQTSTTSLPKGTP